MRIRYALTLAALAILPILAQTPGAQRPAGADWPMYNRDFAGTRFSPLTQIDRGNAALQLAPSLGNRHAVHGRGGTDLGEAHKGIGASEGPAAGEARKREHCSCPSPRE